METAEHGVFDKGYSPPVGHLYHVKSRRAVIPGHDDLTIVEMANLAEATKRARILEARRKFGAFMEYVFFDEHTRKPFKQQWFHDEWSDAWDTEDRVIIIAPRDHGKTSQIVGRVLFELGKNPNLRIKIACAADGRAKERLFEVKQHIEHNKRLHEVFPDLVEDETGEWSKHKLVIRRSAMHRDASVEALGITATATGGRCDLLIADDVVDRRNALSQPAMRDQIKLAWKSDWTNLLEPDSRIWYICTLWHKDDLSHELMANKAYTTLFYAIDDRFGAMWPDKWSSDALKKRFYEIGSVEFNRGFRNQAIDLDSAIVRPEWIRFANLAEDVEFQRAMLADELVFMTSYDTAVGTTAAHDFFAACNIAVNKVTGHVYVVDAWHAHVSIQKQADLIHKEWLKYRPFRVLIEKVGQAVLDEWVLSDHPEMVAEVEVTKPKVGKAERLLGITPLMESMRVTFAAHLDSSSDMWDPGRGDLPQELLDFPIAAHDDLCDAYSQALNAARRYFLDAWASGGDDEPSVDFHIGGRSEDETDGYLW